MVQLIYDATLFRPSYEVNGLYSCIVIITRAARSDPGDMWVPYRWPVSHNGTIATHVPGAVRCELEQTYYQVLVPFATTHHPISFLLSNLSIMITLHALSRRGLHDFRILVFVIHTSIHVRTRQDSGFYYFREYIHRDRECRDVLSLCSLQVRGIMRGFEYSTTSDTYVTEYEQGNRDDL